MALSESIKVRLREGQALVYAAQAEQRGVGIAAFIVTALIRSIGSRKSWRVSVRP
jgi:hypothetical protein